MSTVAELPPIRVPTAEDMYALGMRLAAHLRAGDVVLLTGDLGAGKTTLATGIGAGLNVRGPITSPTFVIAREHPSLSGGPGLVHVDAYRLQGAYELEDLDLTTSLADAVTLVEWGAGLAEVLAAQRLEVVIDRDVHAVAGEHRTVRFVPVGARWEHADLAALADRQPDANSQPEESGDVVLALDTSAAISVAVVAGGELLAEEHRYAPREHAELLTPMIRAAMQGADVAMEDLGLVVAGCGPGPFTGLRAGLVTARVIAHVQGIPVHGVVSLDALAWAAAPLDTPLVVATDARRREVYWARYEPGQVAPRRVAGPAVDRPDDVDVAGARVIGRGVQLYPHLAGEPGIGAGAPAGSRLLDPHAADLAFVALAERRSAAADWPRDPQPLYLRHPDATPPGPAKPVLTGRT